MFWSHCYITVRLRCVAVISKTYGKGMITVFFMMTLWGREDVITGYPVDTFFKQVFWLLSSLQYCSILSLY